MEVRRDIKMQLKVAKTLFTCLMLSAGIFEFKSELELL